LSEELVLVGEKEVEGECERKEELAERKENAIASGW
jgi:hypothetical protein